MWSEFVEALRAQLANQVVAGAIALGLVGVIAASLRGLPGALWSQFKRAIVVTATLDSRNDLFAAFVAWLNDLSATVHIVGVVLIRLVGACLGLGAGEQTNLLTAPHGSRCQVFINPRLESDVMLGEMLLGFPQAEIEIAERAAAVAGNEAGCIQSGGEIAFPLQHGQADQRLGAGQEDAAGGGGVLVVQRRSER